MRNKIILLSQNNHAFIQNELKYVSMEYKEIIVVTPYSEEMNNCCSNYSNVKYYSYCFNKNISDLLMIIKNINWEVCIEVLRAVINNKCDIDYLKEIASYLLFYEKTKLIAKKEIRNTDSNCIAVAMWFSSPAYAVCRLKRVYPELKIVSLAHAFEIDDSRNRQIDFSFKKFCHEHLEKISFISKNRMDTYLNNHVIPNGWKSNHLNLTYLGVTRYVDGISKFSESDSYHIVTCSRCIPLKRLDLLIDALSIITDMEIKWSHIGEGELLPSLMDRSQKLNKKNISIEWLGQYTNVQVHQYLVDTPVDIFLNLSTTEGVSISLLEALAYGIPLIATNVGGNSEVVSDDVGILISANPTKEDIVVAMRKILLADRNKRLELKKAALDKYENLFNGDKLRRDFYLDLKNE